jgi:hypothetical protein
MKTPKKNSKGKGKVVKMVQVVTDPSIDFERPGNPHRLAREWLAHVETTSPNKPARLVYYKKRLLVWRGRVYEHLDDDTLRGKLTAFADQQFRDDLARDVKAWQNNPKTRDNPDGKPEPFVREVTQKLVGDVLGAGKGLCPIDYEVNAPSWLDGVEGPDPKRLAVVANGILNIDAAADGEGVELYEHNPDYLSTVLLPYEYDPAAPKPELWLETLDQIFPGDQAAIDTLQEFAGLLTTAETRFQKQLAMIGPTGSGKGVHQSRIHAAGRRTQPGGDRPALPDRQPRHRGLAGQDAGPDRRQPHRRRPRPDQGDADAAQRRRRRPGEREPEGQAPPQGTTPGPGGLRRQRGAPPPRRQRGVHRPHRPPADDPAVSRHAAGERQPEAGAAGGADRHP